MGGSLGRGPDTTVRLHVRSEPATRGREPRAQQDARQEPPGQGARDRLSARNVVHPAGEWPTAVEWLLE